MSWYYWGMRLAFIALGIMVLVAAGVYIAGSNLSQQYAFENSKSLASSAVCTADRVSAGVGQVVNFTLAGVDAGTPLHWSSDDGRGELAQTGIFRVTYAHTGTKTVWAFVYAGNLWLRVACSVDIR